MSTATMERSLESGIATDVREVRERAGAIMHGTPVECTDAMDRGDYVRQGDIYITKIGKRDIPGNAVPMKKPLVQLAPGDTQGSRHCLTTLDGVTMLEIPGDSDYGGPIIELAKPNTIEHPEHGHCKLPAGIYAITYQRTEDAEGRRRRVQD